MLRAASFLYGSVVRCRNRIFDEQRASVHQAECVVVSVGNLSVGGTGKTPFVQLTARTIAALCKDGASTTEQQNPEQQRLDQRDMQQAAVCVVSRGYRRTSRGEVIVSDGRCITNALSSWGTGSIAEYVGDEALLHAERLLPFRIGVVVNEDRHAAACCAVQQLGARVVVVDDGFQHRKLHRNLDIVLVDRQTLDCPKLLPAGRLREPLESLRRADVVVCMNGVGTEELSSAWLKPSACLIEAQTQASRLYYAEQNDNSRHECGSEIQQQSAFAFCGIAKPERFLRSLTQAGVYVAAHKAFADHHRYTLHDVKSIINHARQKGTSLLVTTEKDAVKIRQPAMAAALSEAGCTLAVLPVECVLTKGQEQWEHIVRITLFGKQLQRQ
jgi:tetraacyldisaccharide 4'-kinase